ncbi:histidine phosphatase family protein [Sphingobium nicotianae]|uniref:Phosphoglycerate mutase family protein n=1 Tax=Sphingobium nicotianae TaxID=2782607 RepID=A0A9X1IRP2_9SPHN|nr:histidine phosphatase family protein [Sphingobium nicotianae]MBT2187484.1 phosphoglycerate mutase family protein [Sphingobium nicotianae]
MIYLIRHGQTEYNVARRFQGGLDSPLTALGAAQARAMGLMLRTLVDPAEAILFTSPRGRTIETAQLIAQEAGIETPPIIEEGLAEISLGSWDGKTGREIDDATSGHWSSLDPHSWYFETPDGERYDAFQARLAASLARVAAHPAPARIIVSHGVAGRVLRGLHSGLPKEDMLALPVPQGVIYRLAPGNITEIDCREAII